MAISLDFTTFRIRFQKLMESRGLNLSRLSDELGIPTASLSRYATGVRTPELAYILALAEYFDVSIDWLLGLDHDLSASFPADVKEIAELYSIASQDDQKVVHAVLDRYRKINNQGEKDDVH